MPKASAILFLCLTTQGCSHLQPWVNSYERGRLADPIMQLERDGISASYMGHVYDAREGARGANGGAGGGCGCN